MYKNPTEFRQRFANWKAGKKVYDAGKPVEDDYIYTAAPSQYDFQVTAEAPTVYWDGFDWIGFNNLGQRVTKGPNFNPSGAKVIESPQEFENARLAQASRADINGTHRFAGDVRNFVTDLVTMPAGDAVAEPLGILGGKVLNTAAKTKAGKAVIKSVENLVSKFTNGGAKTSIKALSGIANEAHELDAAYKAAVESGNKTKALRLLEQAYLESGVPRTDITITTEGNAVGWYHGSEWGNHTIFDSSAMNATIGGSSAHGKIKGNFLTTDVPSAKRYAGSNRYSSPDVPEFTQPQTAVEKLQKLFGRYKSRRLYPAERVGGYAPKPERLFDTKGKAPIDHLDKVDHVVYPLYVNPGEDVMRLDFQGNPWSKSPIEFPNDFYLRRNIRDDLAKTYRELIIPYKDYDTALKAWERDPINIRHGRTSLDGQYFDDFGIRYIEGFNSAPRYETVRLVEERVPNTTNGAVQTAAKEGKTSVLMRNVIDSNGGPEGVGYAIDDFVTLKPNQQKIADITYDDNGDLIPLSQRFNWLKDDSRFDKGKSIKPARR